MPSTEKHKIVEFAPAKLNLYLHIINRRANGYHELDSLVAFADIGDELEIIEHPTFSFVIEGPFGETLKKESSSNNLVVKAAELTAETLNKDLNVEIKLIKNIPVASGLGGGSADAAATIRALLKWWSIEKDLEKDLQNKLISIGADLPVCYLSKSSYISGIGENLSQITLNTIAALIINPNKGCSTAAVFKSFQRPFSSKAQTINDGEDLIKYLTKQDNDLTEAAQSIVPEIKEATTSLKNQRGCQLARMTGSGASCFGVFSSSEEAELAAKEISTSNPEWWIQPCTLNKDLFR